MVMRIPASPLDGWCLLILIKEYATPCFTSAVRRQRMQSRLFGVSYTYLAIPVWSVDPSIALLARPWASALHFWGMKTAPQVLNSFRSSCARTLNSLTLEWHACHLPVTCSESTITSTLEQRTAETGRSIMMSQCKSSMSAAYQCLAQQ